MRLAIVFLAICCFAACTTANEQALARMDGAQRTYLQDSVDKIKLGMSERQVTQILGLPTRGAGSPRVCYQTPKNEVKSEVCVRFVLYKARSVEWKQPGENGFSYNLDLSDKE